MKFRAIEIQDRRFFQQSEMRFKRANRHHQRPILESLEARTVMAVSGMGAAAEAIKGSASISPPVASQTEVIVAVEQTIGYEKLRDWCSTGGEGAKATDFLHSRVLFSNQGVSYVDLKLSRPQDPSVILNALRQERFVTWAAPNMIYDTGVGYDPREYLPNDPLYSSQWHHPLMKNNLAWDVATSMGQGVIVAVVDDGVTLNHPDLSQNIWVNAGEFPGNGIDDDGNGYTDDIRGWDFSSGDNNPNPVGLPSHGTPVAGNIAARIDNNVGLTGVAGKATLLPVRFYGSGAWTSDVVAESYVYAVDNGAKILNVSYNIDQFAADPLFRAALDYVYDTGALYMNSAGNNGQFNPARGVYDQGLFVMASDGSDKMLSYSNYGVDMDIVTPADPVWTTDDTGYSTFNGTSSATPVASGAMALVWAAHPGWTRAQVVAQVLGTADNITSLNPTYAGYLGYGRINTFRAMTETLMAPRLGAVAGLPAEGGVSPRPIGGFSIIVGSIFDESTVTGSSFEMRYAGPDNAFDTSDDTTLPLSVGAVNGGSYKIGTNALDFNVGSSMKPGLYRFTALSNGAGLKDPFGMSLDGNGDGTGGDAFIRNFSVQYQAGGVVYREDNRDGQHQPTELGLAGWTVFSDNNGNGLLDILTAAPQNSVDLPKTISDNATVASNLNVSTAPGSLVNVKVRLSLTHTWDSDVVLTLISPSGTRILLASGRGGSGDNFTSTIFDDAASLAISGGTAPFTGSYRPESPLAGLKGEVANGTWKLEVRDTATGDTGTLTAWGLDIQTTTEYVSATDADGIWVMNGLPTGNYNFVALLPNTTNWAYATPSTGNYSVSLASTGAVGGLDYGIIGRPIISTYAGAALVPAGGDVKFTAIQGTISPPKSITIYNGGAGPAQILDVITAAPFEITSPLPTFIGPGQSADFTVVYHADTPGDFTVPLQIKFLDVDPLVPSVASINLKGHTIIQSISGQYFADLNGNGSLEVGEQPFAGIKLYDDLNNNNALDLGTPTVKAATGLPIAIPDGNYTTIPLNVSGITGLVGGMTVSISATHTWAGDLAFFLVNPSGVAAELYFDATDPRGTNFNVVFDDNAANSIIPGTLPTGTVRPSEPLGPLASGDVNGTWTLYAYDTVTLDSGNLTGFSITFMVGAEPQSTTAVDGTYGFYDLPSGPANIRAINPPTGVYFITPANGLFSTTLAPNQLVTGANFVPLPVSSISGQITDIDTGLGVGKVKIFNDKNNNGLFDYTPVDRTSSTNKIIIRDLKTVSKTVTVSGATLPVYGVEVGLNIQHTHVGDLIVTLVSPGGVRVKLLNRNGNDGQNFVNAVFEEYADSTLPNGIRNYTGRYRPAESLASYNLGVANGTWTLEVYDQAIGDVGYFNNFSLKLITTTEAVAVSNTLGFYTMSQATAGSYNLRVTPYEPGWSVVTPGSGTRKPTLTAGAAANGQNFELRRTVGPASVPTGNSAAPTAPKSMVSIPGSLIAEMASLPMPISTGLKKVKKGR